MKYRVIQRGQHGDFKAQVKYWLWPFWLDISFWTTRCRAEECININKKNRSPVTTVWELHERRIASQDIPPNRDSEKHRKGIQDYFRRSDGLYTCPWCRGAFINLDPGSHVCEGQ